MDAKYKIDLEKIVNAILKEISSIEAIYPAALQSEILVVSQIYPEGPSSFMALSSSW